ncbi:MAG: NUDIX domain-containing protein [Alphaproteobacteria bacterium]|nr:NUDIX domain-containing protein [Alphaproteobacteria bacterium]
MTGGADAGTPIRSLTVSVYLLRGKGAATEVLLLLRSKTPAAGCWFAVTGRVEPAEGAIAAAWREVQEETGLVPERLYAANWVEQWFPPEGRAIMLAPVFVGITAPGAVVTLNDEHGDSRWVSIAAAMELVTFPVQRDSLEHVRREFIGREPQAALAVARTSTARDHN